MKTILITGGSRGIGKATVNHFLQNNWKVITTSTTGTLNFTDPNLEACKLQLEDSNSIEQLASTLINKGHALDALLNNAWKAIQNEESSNNISSTFLTSMLVTNLVGTINLTQQLLPIINENGVIINVSSQLGSLKVDWGYMAPAYRIAKAGLNMFTRNYYKNPEVISKDISVYSFDPGWVKTDMGGQEAPREPEEPAIELFNLVNSKLPSGKFYRGLEKIDW